MHTARQLWDAAKIAFKSKSKSCLFWLSAPPEVLSLQKTVNRWLSQAKDGDLSTVTDFNISYAHSIGGDTPFIYFHLFKAVEYTETLRDKNASAYTELTTLIDNTIKGLVFKSLSAPKNEGICNRVGGGTFRGGENHYNEGVRTCMDLLRKKNSPATGKWIVPGSPLEASLCERLFDTLQRVYERQVQDGYGYHIKYMLNTIGEAYVSEDHTDACNQTIKQAFGQFYAGMSKKQRQLLKTMLHDPNERYRSGFISMVETVIAKAQARTSPSLGPKTHHQ